MRDDVIQQYFRDHSDGKILGEDSYERKVSMCRRVRT